MKRGFAASVVPTIGLLALLVPTARAQTTGAIVGRVTDESGGGLAEATVEGRSASLQGTRITFTAQNGSFRLSALPPGLYSVTAARPPFEGATRTVTVGLDSTATLDFTLRLSASEYAVVLGEARRVDTSSTTTGTSYTSDIVARLPSGRNYADIIRANPGVVGDHGFNNGRSLSLSIYGATSAEHQWMIDGVNTTYVIKGIQGKTINNEFVQEVEVKTGGYQAEYGRATGGVINVITKSGGNQFRGGAFVYYDTEAFQASRVSTEEDSPLGGMRVAKYSRTDFGVDLGGFVVKDRLWFFAAYNRVVTPAKVSRYVSSEQVPDTMQFPLDGTDNLFSGKLTWNVSSGSTLVGTVFGDPTKNTGAASVVKSDIASPDPSTWQSTLSIGGTDYALRLDQLLGIAGLLSIQASRHQDRHVLDATGSGRVPQVQDFTCSGGTPEAPCDQATEPNFATGGLGYIGGAGYHSASHRDQIRTDATLYHGAHEIKLGGDYQESRTHAVWSYTGGQLVRRYNESGTVYYEHFFYARSPTDLTPASFDSRPSSIDLGLFVQDSWSAAPGLTINAGLRFDQEDIRDYSGDTVIKTTNEWQPRVGVVWDPGRDGTAKVYAFAGRFYYALPTDLAARTYGSNTFAITYNFDPVDVTHDPNAFGGAGPLKFGSAYGDPVDRKLRGIYQDEYTLGVEKAFGSSWTLGVKATYRRLGNVIEDRCDLDYNAPENRQSTCAIMNPGSGGRYARGAFHYCTGLDDFNNCARDPEVPLFPAPAVPPERLDGFYVTPFKLSVGLQAWVRSGAPLDQLGYFNANWGSAIRLVPRGYAGRLPAEWDANLTLSYPISVGPLTATLQAYVYNLFNNQIPTDQDTMWSVQPAVGYPETIYDANQKQTNPDYGKVTGRSDPRLFRAAIRIAF